MNTVTFLNSSHPSFSSQPTLIGPKCFIFILLILYVIYCQSYDSILVNNLLWNNLSGQLGDGATRSLSLSKGATWRRRDSVPEPVEGGDGATRSLSLSKGATWRRRDSVPEPVEGGDWATRFLSLSKGGYFRYSFSDEIMLNLIFSQLAGSNIRGLCSWSASSK